MNDDKLNLIERAASMNKVPLIQLDSLIKERCLAAKSGDYELVEQLNTLICKLLFIYK